MIQKGSLPEVSSMTVYIMLALLFLVIGGIALTVFQDQGLNLFDTILGLEESVSNYTPDPNTSSNTTSNTTT